MSSTASLFGDDPVEAPDGSDALFDVAIPVPLRRTFAYRAPPELAERLLPGCRVAVPFGRRKVPAFVVGRLAEPPTGVKRILNVAGLLEDEPVFPPELFSFLVEAARYYLHPLGEVLRAAAPALPSEAMRRLRAEGFLDGAETLPGVRVATRTALRVRRTDEPAEGRLGASQKRVLALLEERGELDVDEIKKIVRGARGTVVRLRERGLVATEEVEVVADPFFHQPVERDTPPSLNDRQRQAVEAISAALEPGAEGPSSFLLQGVTGSGKTEVYLQVIARARASGRGALLLVPEIALTPQLVGRFRARFGDSIAVLHSGLGDRERKDAWRALRTGAVSLAVGARSALFAPVQSLGVLVVDEEHDPSFKQEEGFRYNARDLALLRAQRASAVCVLGSATPAVESRHLADGGRLGFLRLPERATQQSLPSVEIVDLRRHRQGPSGHRLLSAPLHRALADCLADGDQAILFLNRRGFAPSLRCEACGEVVECPACSVALTEHRRAGLLRCHYCDYVAPPGGACPACGEEELSRVGIGTEKLEETLREVFAPARVARLDRDTAAGAGVERVLDRLRRREIDILVGTQMVTKGHDVPGVTVVGVIMADQSLAFPDFRAAERTFQLLSQVSGRAGRGERPGRVVIQTFSPEHFSVVAAASHNYERFYSDELSARRELGYPPFARLVAVRIDAGDEDKARSAAGALAEVGRRRPEVRQGRVVVLGPAAAPIARIRGRYRYRLLLRGAERRALRRVAAAIAARIDEGLSPARASVDIDPVSML